MSMKRKKIERKPHVAQLWKEIFIQSNDDVVESMKKRVTKTARADLHLWWVCLFHDFRHVRIGHTKYRTEERIIVDTSTRWNSILWHSAERNRRRNARYSCIHVQHIGARAYSHTHTLPNQKCVCVCARICGVAALSEQLLCSSKKKNHQSRRDQNSYQNLHQRNFLKNFFYSTTFFRRFVSREIS